MEQNRQFKNRTRHSWFSTEVQKVIQLVKDNVSSTVLENSDTTFKK